MSERGGKFWLSLVQKRGQAQPRTDSRYERGQDGGRVTLDRVAIPLEDITKRTADLGVVERCGGQHKARRRDHDRECARFPAQGAR